MARVDAMKEKGVIQRRTYRLYIYNTLFEVSITPFLTILYLLVYLYIFL